MCKESMHCILCIHVFLNCFFCDHRRWVPLVRKGKATTWMSGQFSVVEQCGNVRRRSVSATRPQKHCCQWQGSSTDGQSTVRGKFTPCLDPASTACGRLWRASSWSPVRTWLPTDTTATHTQNSNLFFSFFSHLHSFLPGLNEKQNKLSYEP